MNLEKLFSKSRQMAKKMESEHRDPESKYGKLHWKRAELYGLGKEFELKEVGKNTGTAQTPKSVRETPPRRLRHGRLSRGKGCSGREDTDGRGQLIRCP